MTIPVSIELQHVKVAKRLLEYIERKLSKLDHFLPDIESAAVELSLRAGVRSLSERKVAQVTVHARGKLLRAEETSDDLRTAVDRAIEKIHRQVEHFKGKHTARRSVRGGLPRISAMLAEAPEIEIDDEAAVDEIMRRKSFKISLMSEFEAVDQMLLLGHTFFVFLHADTSHVNVVYRRKGGGYGLLLPELA
ncbi:ribosomal subunit interface protein [Anaerolineae bacterium]|nr:ribosome hibernation promotion factor [Anaerolineaceae bacterium]GBL38248.1 ribosome hibernation promotion factor [Anaerolineaceae bacterium]GDX68148.1 ribosomal subunit interface protein [Anaerolineae bacterium]